MSREIYDNYDLSLRTQLTERSRLINQLAEPDGPLYEAARARYAQLRDGKRYNHVPRLDSAVGTVLDTLVVPAQAGAVPCVSTEIMAREADEALEEAAERHKDAILRAAAAVGMREPNDYRHVAHILDNSSGTKKEFIIEGGRGYASIVRRGVMGRAIEACDRGMEVVHHFGDDRRITPMLRSRRWDNAKSAPNPEHALIRELSGDYFAPEQIFNEHEANFALAERQGYKIVKDVITDEDLPYRRFTSLMKDADPGTVSAMWLFMYQPEGRGLTAGLDVVERDLIDKTPRLIIATDGYRRPMAELEALRWTRNRGHEYRRPVVVGDVPGETFAYGDCDIIVPEYSAKFYAERLAEYGRMLLSELTHWDQRPTLYQEKR